MIGMNRFADDTAPKAEPLWRANIRISTWRDIQGVEGVVSKQPEQLRPIQNLHLISKQRVNRIKNGQT